MPIAPTTFDKAFRLLELDVITSHHCSWENYALYNDAIRAVQRRLQDVGEIGGARLIDAHSFCWILVRLEASERAVVVIPLPQAVIGLRPSIPNKASVSDSNTFAQIDEAWFAGRDE